MPLLFSLIDADIFIITLPLLILLHYADIDIIIDAMPHWFCHYYYYWCHYYWYWLFHIIDYCFDYWLHYIISLLRRHITPLLAIADYWIAYLLFIFFITPLAITPLAISYWHYDITPLRHWRHYWCYAISATPHYALLIHYCHYYADIIIITPLRHYFRHYYYYYLITPLLPLLILFIIIIIDWYARHYYWHYCHYWCHYYFMPLLAITPLMPLRHYWHWCHYYYYYIIIIDIIIILLLLRHIIDYTLLH
jgi:hypothetical protein